MCSSSFRREMGDGEGDLRGSGLVAATAGTSSKPMRRSLTSLNPRLSPSPARPSYLVLRALATQMRAQVEAHFGDRNDLTVVDVGCGERPYEPLFEGRAARYVGVDITSGPNVDVVAPAEELPFQSESFDCVVCSQMLEHAEDPARVLAELHRVLRPGGVAFVSTHGVIRYHPDPDDFWRWTQTGLHRLFAGSAGWSEVQVTPNGGVATAIAYLIGWELAGVGRRGWGEALMRPLFLALNAIAWNLDRARRLRAGGSTPPLAANYLVAATR